MKSYLRLLRYILPHWRRVVLLVVTLSLFASLSGVSLTLIPPFLKIIIYGKERQQPGTGAAVTGGTQGIPLPAPVERFKGELVDKVQDYLYRGSPGDRLHRFCLIIFVLMFLKNLFGYVQTFLTIYLEQRVIYQVRGEVYAHLHRLPLAFFDREKTGHIISRITNDVTLLRGAVVGAPASLIRNSLMTVIALFIVLMVSWKLSLLTFIVLPLNIYLINIIGRKLKRRSFRTREGMADMTSVLEETVAGMRVAKAFGTANFEERRFDRFNLRFMKQFLKMKLLGSLSSPTSELLGTASVVLILWYGGKQVLAGGVSPENLVLFIGAMLWVVTPIKELSKLNNVVQESIASAERIFYLLDLPTEPSPGRGRKVAFTDSIRFEKVSFCYRPGVEVLKDVSFTVRPGEVVAIVGPSGAGKTTLVDLIPRFYEPTSGRVLFDGVDTREADIAQLRAMIGLVTQETILFNDTVRNNIAYGRDDCPFPKVVEAAKAANAHEFIVELPQGYDTLVGERGAQLSGGQKQRLAIARAILKDPRILILDEATSALDSQSEALVQEAIEWLLKGRTTFVIAHRLSTVQNADRILVLDGGRLTESGSHHELIEAGGVYKKLYDMQFRVVG